MVQIEKRPRMYFGNIQGLYSGLCGFLHGIDAFPHMRSGPMDDAIAFVTVPNDFREFTRDALGVKEPNTLGWQDFIAAASETEDDAFKLFFELWHAYLATTNDECPTSRG